MAVTKPSNAGIVLIHGAGLGKWIWDPIIPSLEYPTLPLDFPNRESSTEDLTLEDYAEHLLEEVERWNISRYILVGHSIGGMLASKLVQQLEADVVGLVGICATFPVNGGSFVSTLPLLKRMVMKIILPLAGTKPPDKAIVKSLCNNLSTDQTETVVKRFTAESPRLFLERCEAEVPEVESLFIKTMNDQEMPEALQLSMAENLYHAKIKAVPSGHLPMLSDPKTLTAIVNRFTANLVSEHNNLI